MVMNINGKPINHLWPVLSRNIGSVDDYREEGSAILFCPPELEYEARKLLEPDYQRRRIYSDEIEIGHLYITRFKMNKLARETLELTLATQFINDARTIEQDYQIVFNTNYKGK